ncbi:HNH endonuclease [Waterburya agarophytonicola K14]|uniref:HNH endonuclease n=1 Tax=Waterburya agarophytonicola KI4 TaxID=2874699 RepID=A0A964BY85_9CYAN|nr:HNH endonuclease [Waterburya agarophytonicola KI4]
MDENLVLRHAPEYWQTIEEFPNYLISNLGRVKSKKTRKILKPYKTNRGYLTVGFWLEGRKKRVSIHRLVAQAFLLNPGNLPEVNHINGCKTDNTLVNLEYCTRRSNVIHAFRTGLQKTKLSKKMVLKVFEYRKQGLSLREVGKLLGVSHSTIWEIEKGLIYQDL